MTWNIWDGGGDRVPLIAEVIAAASPDVLLLNEADDHAVVADLACICGRAAAATNTSRC